MNNKIHSTLGNFLQKQVDVAICNLFHGYSSLQLTPCLLVPWQASGKDITQNSIITNITQPLSLRMRHYSVINYSIEQTWK